MASEQTMHPVNGNYGAPPPYTAAELPVHNMPPTGPNGANNPGTAGTAAPADGQPESPSKDEVGWYFVEQYYTTLSKNPEKLHLFYNKKSQFVSGVEAEKAPVSVGQRAIDERIKEMGVEECKVRVTNVDSQDSHDKSIVVQVIGEMSNKNEPHKKFVQTFVLAKQQNGYFVLNDIFRHIAEDEEEELEESAPEAEETQELAPAEPEIKTLTSSDDLVAQAKDAEIVDQKLERSKGSQPAALSAAVIPQVAVPEGIRAPSQKAESQKDVGEIDQVSDGIEIETDHPKDPEPTPAPPSPIPQEATPVKEATPPPKPSAPKTWASMLASGAAKVPAPTAPAPAPAATSSQAAPVQQKKAPAATPASAPAPQLSTSSTPPADDGQPLASPGGWQTAGQDHNRKQKANAATANTNRDGSIKAYVKNVTERVDGPTLKSTLAKYGKIEYFDISRQKNCAFVEFADLTGFNAAVAANPHVVSGEDIYVEERHIRQQPYGQGFNSRGGRGGMRGGMDGRSNSQGGRGGFNKEGGRGNFQARGRGGSGSMTPRGRGMPQAA